MLPTLFKAAVAVGALDLMDKDSRPSLWKGAVAGLAGGLVGTWVRRLAEPRLQDLGEQLFPPPHWKKERPGADPQGKPDRMPSAKLAQKVTSETISREAKLKAQRRLPWAFGTLAGGAYGVMAEFMPVEAGRGVPAGAALFAGTHLTSFPAAGLQARPDHMPASWWVWEFGSHLVYGLAVDTTRRVVRRVL